jgi:SAM-dependent methyltransferase
LISKRLIEDVTLVAVAGQPRFVYPTMMAVLHSVRSIPFKNVKFFIPEDCDFFLEGIDIVPIPAMSYDEYGKFILTGLADHIETPHCLTIQDDGFIVNPNMWEDEFLDYDYMGALWRGRGDPKTWVNGNGGFSLRSKRLLDEVKLLYEEIHGDEPPKPNHRKGFFVEDQWICKYHRKEIESRGIAFAPVEMCQDFSVEFEHQNEKTFGFHGSKYKLMPPHNFHDYMTKDCFAYSEIKKRTLNGSPDLWQSYKKYNAPCAYGDAGTLHNYINFYNHLFKHGPHENVSVLDLGCGRGYTMALWSDYFKNSKVVGLDLYDYCEFDTSDNFITYICDVTDKQQLDSCLGDMKFDYIIDDASHEFMDFCKSFKFLEERLNDRGVYVIQSCNIRQAETQKNNIPVKFFQIISGNQFKKFDFTYLTNQKDDTLMVMRKNN